MTRVLELRLRPAGSNPDASDTEYGSAPPITLSVAEYGVPIVPFTTVLVCDSVEMRSGNVFEAVVPLKSVTCNCTAKVPVTSGVPHSSTSPGCTLLLVVPLPTRNDIPCGSPLTDQENGAVPPDVTTPVRLHGTPRLQSVHVQTDAAIGDLVEVEIVSAGPRSLGGALALQAAA